MSYVKNKIDFLTKISNSIEFEKDIALQRIFEIIKSRKSQKELNKERNLINRIAVDSVLNCKTIELILRFTDS